MITEKPVVMWLSDSALMNTGYATITRNVLNGLSKKGWDCHQISHNYVGQPLPPGVRLDDGTEISFRIWGRGREDYCKDVLQDRLVRLRPDFFVTLLDTFMLFPWSLDHSFSPARAIFYFPSDGSGGLPLNCHNILKHFGHSVAMSRFGQRQVKELYGIDAAYIPHGVDAGLFSPLSVKKKEELRENFDVVSINGSRVKGFLKGKFVVGCVSRNQGRKMLDLAVKAFAPFAKNKPDAVLYFHSDVMDSAAVFDLRDLIRQLGLENRVVFSNMRYFENFDVKDMPGVYNMMDVFLLPTSGEGFGIPTLEAMSCGVPVVVPNNTTGPELVVWDGVCGRLVRQAAEITGSWNVERGVMDVGDCVRVLDELYCNPVWRVELGRVGREKAVNFYDWGVVMSMWDDYLRGLLR